MFKASALELLPHKEASWFAWSSADVFPKSWVQSMQVNG